MLKPIPPKTVLLETDFEKDFMEIPFSEYPRPQMKRDSYVCLNGKWNFEIHHKGNVDFSGEIILPFVPESRISGVLKEIKKGSELIYSREFSFEKCFGKRLILHVGACDQIAKVFVNGKPAGENQGGYLPFQMDITDLVKNGGNTLKIIAKDDMDLELPYGKQTEKRGGMWYTKISGVWQTVWMEEVPENYIKNIKIIPDLKGVDLEIIGGEEEKTLLFQGEKYNFESSHFRLDVESPVHWTPESPKLYEFALISGDDKIESYFGLRTIEIKEIKGKSFICLNGKPYFFHGLLDQGYFSDGIFLPASERGFKEDILRMKKCGFNMLRKHIKLEPDLFYYYCDKFGMVVFQDMINSGKYNFVFDTALPTVGIKQSFDRRVSKRRKENFDKTCFGIMDLLHNHPSVVYYTIFNEGWGQFDADEYYKLFKAYDQTRIFDATSGWFKKHLSDVESLHIYFKPVNLSAVKGKPLVLSEFGGYSCKVENHSFNLDKNYGYKTFKDCNAFEEGLIRLYENEIVPAITSKGLNATVLTQLSDVEDETNGLLTYDRKVLKASEEKLQNLASRLFESFDKTWN